MAKFTRREFSRLCGGAAVSATAFRVWPAFAQPSAAADAEKLTSLSLTEVSAMIRNRSVTSTELVKALLARIAVYNPKVDAYVTVMAEDALKQAAELDAEQKSGKLRSPLHGIPVALKDNIDTAGTRTTAASPMFKDRVPTEDAAIVQKLKAAGAVILGKTNLHEFALGCTGDVSYFGPARNPWALDHVTGGSSSGSAAAVAADLCFSALGTDTGGSIRVPSAWCGAVGLKPTVGLVSIRGIIPCTADLDHCGPIARTVEDCALMLNSMAGYDNLDIFSVHSEPQDYVKLMKEPISSLRIGLPASFYDHVEDEVSKPVMEAIAVLSKMTAGVTSHAPLLEATGLGQKLGDADYYHGELIREYGLNYMPPTRARFERMMNPPPGTHEATAAESAEAHQKLALIRRTIDATFTNFDVVVVPTVRSVPPTIDASLALEVAGPNSNKKVYDWFQGNSGCSNTSPFDLYGVPAITVPCGFSASGMPIGLMIAGPHFTEGRILALAYAYQQATQWHTKRPLLTPDTPVPPIVEKPAADKKEAS